MNLDPEATREKAMSEKMDPGGRHSRAWPRTSSITGPQTPCPGRPGWLDTPYLCPTVDDDLKGEYPTSRCRDRRCKGGARSTTADVATGPWPGDHRIVLQATIITWLEK